MNSSLLAYVLAVLTACGTCWPRAAAAQAGDRPDERAPWWTSVEQLERAVAADPGVVGRRYRRGWTVLHVAAERGDAAIVQWLLRNGAEATVRAERGETPLHAAMRPPPEDRAAFERRWNGGANPSAEPRQYARVAELLLQHGADPNAPTSQGGTPLHSAAAVGNAELVKLLLDRGADANPAGGDESPLRSAVTRGNVPAVRALLDGGADPRAGEERDRVLLAQAAARHEGLLPMLIAAGADVSARPDASTPGGNALGVAALNARAEAVAALIEAGVTHPELLGGAMLSAVSQRDRRTANDRLKVVRLLLDAGAPVNYPGDSGMAVRIAQDNGHGAIARLLKRHGGRYDAAKAKAAQRQMEERRRRPAE